MVLREKTHWTRWKIMDRNEVFSVYCRCVILYTAVDSSNLTASQKRRLVANKTRRRGYGSMCSSVGRSVCAGCHRIICMSLSCWPVGSTIKSSNCVDVNVFNVWLELSAVHLFQFAFMPFWWCEHSLLGVSYNCPSHSWYFTSRYILSPPR
jgi:hypothetical protein